MTKKDYELIARVFKIAIVDSRANEPEVTENYQDLASFMAHKLGQENPKFDRNKFLTACGIVQDTSGNNDFSDWVEAHKQ